jgi:hypothetical protein
LDSASPFVVNSSKVTALPHVKRGNVPWYGAC